MIKVDITDKLIKVNITDEMIDRANKRAKIDKAIYGFHNSASFTDDKNRFLGLLGEEVVSSYFKTPLINLTDYDIILNGERVEIKSQGINSSRIWNDFDVNSMKLCQDTDKYMFVIVHNSFRYAWIVGHMERRKFNDNCRRVWYKKDLKYKVYAGELNISFRRYKLW